MNRLEGIYLLGTFVALSAFTSWLEAEEPTWIPPDARTYRLVTDEGTDRESFVRATVFCLQDGRFYVAVWAPPYKHEWECDGVGKLEKDGWIHFSWTDNFTHKGTGAVRFLDHGARLAVNSSFNRGDGPLQISKSSWILPWTREPVLADVRTAPHGYLIRLPAAYEDNEGGLNRLTLMPQRGGKIKIIGNFRMASLGNARDIFFISTGTWRDGDRLVFSFHENETKDRGEGIFQFLGPDKAVLHLSYTFKSDPKKEADARNFNAKNLSFLRDADRKPWEIAGIGEESEEQ